MGTVRRPSQPTHVVGVAAEDLRFGEKTKPVVLREGCGQDVGEFQAVAGRVEELGAIAYAFVEGGSFQVAVTEDRSG